MEPGVAAWLVSPEAAPLLDAAMAEDDPTSTSAATRLRRLTTPERAAAVLGQAALRRRGRAKFGPDADRWFFTPDGLEQATRPRVASARAGRLARSLADAGSGRVVDLGCGLGADAAACAASGLAVTAVERDEVTATFAAANVPAASVVRGDATALAPTLLGDGDAVFCDPARRTARGRTWRVEDLTPPWDFVAALLDGGRVAAAKLGPGVPTRLLPASWEVEWVSDRGTVVEACAWAGPGATPGRRGAVVDGRALRRDAEAPLPAPRAPGAYLYEPDGAVIRAGLVGRLAADLDAAPLADGIAYLTGDRLVPTPFADAFAVVDVLPYQEKRLRAWVRERRVGVLEIKKRGLDADPAALRKRLRPQGPNAATLVLTPTAFGAVAIVAERAPGPA